MKHFTADVLHLFVASANAGRCHRANVSIGINEEDAIIKLYELFMKMAPPKLDLLTAAFDFGMWGVCSTYVASKVRRPHCNKQEGWFRNQNVEVSFIEVPLLAILRCIVDSAIDMKLTSPIALR